ncbi:MAG: NAD(P)/FAD-dependent oxidoreductase, partial [Beijerinckiaceae bacterium]
KQVTVVETAPRVMGRAVSPAVSEAFAAKHRAMGTDLRFGAALAGFIGEKGAVKGLRLADGEIIPAELVLVGIGVLAEDRMAQAAGLAIDNGIVVDAQLRTSDPAIFAIGDNNRHPNPFFGGALRLECVQNAVDQARAVARSILGRGAPYHALPWFWSDQGDWKLQIAGVAPAFDKLVVRGDPASGAFSVFGFSGGWLRAVESVNKPADHMAARKLLGLGRSITPEQASDRDFDLRAAALGGGASGMIPARS